MIEALASLSHGTFFRRFTSRLVLRPVLSAGRFFAFGLLRFFFFSGGRFVVFWFATPPLPIRSAGLAKLLPLPEPGGSTYGSKF